jgi:hypothetical protein
MRDITMPIVNQTSKMLVNRDFVQIKEYYERMVSKARRKIRIQCFPFYSVMMALGKLPMMGLLLPKTVLKIYVYLFQATPQSTTSR